jgi:lysophospholipase L1-like esterase
MIVSGQHIGVADQIKKGEVNTVIVYIGANDYAPFITGSGYDAIYNGTLSEADSIKKRNDIISDIKTSLEVLENAGDVEIILVAIPHWSNNFGISLAFPIPERRKYVVTAVTDTNKAIKELAQEHNIPVIDPNDFYTKITGENNGSIVVGGIKLERLLINNDPKNMFLDDGIHPGTVINMLFANEVISTLNSSFGKNFREFTDEEILKISGINR